MYAQTCDVTVMTDNNNNYFCRHSGYLIWKSWMRQAKDHCQVNNKQDVLNANQHKTTGTEHEQLLQLSVIKYMFKHFLAVTLMSKGGYKMLYITYLSVHPWFYRLQ